MSRPARSVVWSLFVGGALRVYGLGSESLWLDEANTARRMAMGFRGLFFDVGSGSQLPLYFWISKVWCSLAGTGEAALRAPALLFGLLLIPAVYFLGRELVDEKAGAWGALLVAVNPYLLHYSQEARPYTLYALLAVTAWLFLARWLRTRRGGDLVGFWAATAGVLYTHPLGLLILPAHLCLLWVYTSRGEGIRLALPDPRGFWTGMALVGLFYLPLLNRVVRELSLTMEGVETGGSWLPEPGWWAPLGTLGQYFMSPWLAGVVVGLALTPPLSRFRADPRGRRLLLLGLSVWAAFTGLPWIVSQFLIPVYHSRYGIPALPILLLLAGYGISRLRPPGRWAGALFVAVLTLPPLYDYHTKLDKAPVRESFQELAERSRAGELVVRDPGWLNPLTTYYLHPPPGVKVLSPYTVEVLEDALSRTSRVWVITKREGYLGVAELLRSGTIPGWVLASREGLLENPRVNRRALLLEDLTVSLFERAEPSPSPEGPRPDAAPLRRRRRP